MTTITQEEQINVTPEQSSDAQEQSKLFDFNEARSHLETLRKDWKDEEDETKRRREVRDIEINAEQLRKDGKLDKDETLIPVRICDTNITREQPSFINYLKNSRRLMTFRSLTNPEQDPQLIEQEFTRGMTYIEWENSHFKIKDGADTHGWCACEVVLDESKPLNVGIEYIEHENLYWPKSVKNIQDAPRIIRKYDVTISVLRKWVRKFGFNAAQVNTIADSLKDTKKEVETVSVYKLFFKFDGTVYVAWFSLDHGVADWLKSPAKHYVGIANQVEEINLVPNPMTGIPTPNSVMRWQDSDLDMYPIFVLKYRESEKPTIVEAKGRVFLDEPKQEAQTAILSGFINGLTRASNVYASPASDDGTGDSLKELKDVALVGGRILSKPMQFWHPDYPDPMVIRALQYLDVSNSQETNQINFAVNNRQDSRKTATEITAAQQDQQNINSVQLTLFSTYIRSIYSFAWLIVQSQALQNKISFLLIKQTSQEVNPITGQPQEKVQWVNDIATISQKWELRSAGDTDVIQRQQKINQMKQDWPVIANTPLAARFLADLMKLEYPDVGEQYAQAIMQIDQTQMMQGMVASLNTILKGVVNQNPEILRTVPPQQAEQMKQIMLQADQMTAQLQQQKQQEPHTRH